MALINKDNLGQISQMSKHIRRKGKKYRAIFPNNTVQQSSSDGNEDTLFVDRSNKK